MNTARSYISNLILIAFCVSEFSAANPMSLPWTVVTTGTSSESPLSTINFVNDKIGWMCAGRNTILKTIDGGIHWSVLNTNLRAESLEVTRLSFTNEDLGWAVGAVNHQPAIWESRDGGASWSIMQQWPGVNGRSLGALLDVAFIDEKRGWAAGFNGLNAIIVATNDGGRHWAPQYSGSEITGQFSRIRFADARNGWALSPMAVMQTENGGESWHLRHFDGGLLNDIDTIGASEAWVAGSWGSLLFTHNGVSWSKVRLTDLVGDSFLGWVKFVTRNVGWASGTKGEIIVTHDGGKTWKRDSLPEGTLGPEMSTGEMAVTSSAIFVIANPGRLLVRSIP